MGDHHASILFSIRIDFSSYQLSVLGWDTKPLCASVFSFLKWWELNRICHRVAVNIKLYNPCKAINTGWHKASTSFFFFKCNFLVSPTLHCSSLWTLSKVVLKNCSKPGGIGRKSIPIPVGVIHQLYFSFLAWLSPFSLTVYQEESSSEFQNI